MLFLTEHSQKPSWEEYRVTMKEEVQIFLHADRSDSDRNREKVMAFIKNAYDLNLSPKLTLAWAAAMYSFATWSSSCRDLDAWPKERVELAFDNALKIGALYLKDRYPDASDTDYFFQVLKAVSFELAEDGSRTQREWYVCQALHRKTTSS